MDSPRDEDTKWFLAVEPKAFPRSARRAAVHHAHCLRTAGNPSTLRHGHAERRRDRAILETRREDGRRHSLQKPEGRRVRYSRLDPTRCRRASPRPTLHRTGEGPADRHEGRGSRAPRTGGAGEPGRSHGAVDFVRGACAGTSGFRARIRADLTGSLTRQRGWVSSDSRDCRRRAGHAD